MKKFFTIFCLTVLTTMAIQTVSKAQGYDHAIGGRFGAANGITFKTGLAQDAMLDLILNFRSNNNYKYFRLTGLYEVYKPISADAPGLNWYYGAGASIGSVKFEDGIYHNNDFYFSVDGVLGLDYKFADAPVNLSLDWKPAIQLAPGTDFDGSGIAISIRYTF